MRAETYIDIDIDLRVITVYSCPILMKVEFTRQILEKDSNISFMKIRPVGAELFHADRRTDGKDWQT